MASKLPGQKIFNQRSLGYFNALEKKATMDHIVHEFGKVGSRIRVLIATVAYGLGMDVPDVRIVINYGAPSTAMTYWQEVGRAGRDGHPSVNILIPYRGSLHPAYTSKDIISYAKNAEQCHRATILGYFLLENMTLGDIGKTSGCSLDCTSSCDCDLCRCCTICKDKCQCPAKKHIAGYIGLSETDFPISPTESSIMSISDTTTPYANDDDDGGSDSDDDEGDEDDIEDESVNRRYSTDSDKDIDEVENDDHDDDDDDDDDDDGHNSDDSTDSNDVDDHC